MSGFLRFVAYAAVIIGALCAIGYYTYADVWVVPADDPRMAASVEPMLRSGDIVLVERSPAPELGKLFRCADPDEPRRFVVGRLVGPAGSTFTLLNQRFDTPGSHERADTACGEQNLTNTATGEELTLQCSNREFAGLEYRVLTHLDESAPGPQVLHIPAGKGYLLSDDRYLHFDSRDYGLVPEATCQRVLFRLWGGAGFSDGSRRFNIIW